ncbi:MAG: UDP-N-acetylglucosamine 2-epimerase [Candidatus Nanopelagicales bacterium]
MSRKICVITGSRAEYGLLRWVMQGIKDHPDLTLQLIVTGMHLSEDFGMTVDEIENDGFAINDKIEILSYTDSSLGISQSMADALLGFAEAFHRLKPDLVLLLGDRFEIFSAATSAHVARIPIAHIHGGESTEGVIDEAFRHSITKMSQLHFVAADEYQKRVIQLGENPEKVFLVGGLGIDGINNFKLLDKKILESKLDFEFGIKNLLVTFHPVTLENLTAKDQMKELFLALSELKDTKIIFTMPNSDAESKTIFQLIQDFVQHNPNAKCFYSLGQQKYFSTIMYVDAVVGNSSSGLLEVPSFKKPTVDIGDRQRGRIKAKSVISCEPKAEDIRRAIKELYSSNFQNTLQEVESPFGKGGASQKILTILESVPLEALLKKKFYNLDIL